MESREVDRNLSIVHYSIVQCSIAPGREAPFNDDAAGELKALPRRNIGGAWELGELVPPPRA
jgi:hypothetical protein